MPQHIYKQHLLDKLRDELISGQSRYTIIRNLRNGAYDWWPDSGEKSDTILYKYVAEAADTCKFETMAARDEAKALHWSVILTSTERQMPQMTGQMRGQYWIP